VAAHTLCLRLAAIPLHYFPSYSRRRLLMCGRSEPSALRKDSMNGPLTQIVFLSIERCLPNSDSSS
jgi:hypothetical protein